MMEQTKKKKSRTPKSIREENKYNSIMTRVGTLQTAINFKRYGHLKNILHGSS
jgi:hypothetical protein